MTNTTMFHVTATVNRESILRHGLDWRYMGAAPGIARSGRRPEMAAVFLCETLFDVGFYTGMSHLRTDVWAVDLHGFDVEPGPDGWVIVRAPISADRLKLVYQDLPARTWQNFAPPDSN